MIVAEGRLKNAAGAGVGMRGRHDAAPTERRQIIGEGQFEMRKKETRWGNIPGALLLFGAWRQRSYTMPTLLKPCSIAKIFLAC